jgi:hypothetical protein
MGPLPVNLSGIGKGRSVKFVARCVRSSGVGRFLREPCGILLGNKGEEQNTGPGPASVGTDGSGLKDVTDDAGICMLAEGEEGRGKEPVVKSPKDKLLKGVLASGALMFGDPAANVDAALVCPEELKGRADTADTTGEEMFTGKRDERREGKRGARRQRKPRCTSQGDGHVPRKRWCGGEGRGLVA